MHEGNRLRQLCEDRGVTQVQLAKAAGKSRAAAFRWYCTQTFSAKMWKTVRQAMEAVNIEPTLVRAKSEAQDLIEMLGPWSHDQLEAAERLLLASETERKYALSFIQYRLKRKPR